MVDKRSLTPEEIPDLDIDVIPSREAKGKRARPLSPPVNFLAILRERHRLRKAREERIREFERRVRLHEQPPDDLFDLWLDDCVDEEGAERRLTWLSRSFEARLADLFPAPSQSSTPIPQDRLMTPRLKEWGVLGNPTAESAVAELITYLEDTQDEAQRARSARTTWEVADAERANAIVKALKVVVREALDYVRELPGDEPTPDPQIGRVFRQLMQLQPVLRKLEPTKVPKATVGHPLSGPERNWPVKVRQEVRRRLDAVYECRDTRFTTEETQAHLLGNLTNEIAKRLGIAGRRGFDFSSGPKDCQDTKPVDWKAALLRKLADALGRQRLPKSRPASS